MLRSYAYDTELTFQNVNTLHFQLLRIQQKSLSYFRCDDTMFRYFRSIALSISHTCEQYIANMHYIFYGLIDSIDFNFKLTR